MLRILLLDCSDSLEKRLKEQGFDVESGTVGFCTGERKLPSQVYEKDIFVYNPDRAAAEDSGNLPRIINEATTHNRTPQYSLGSLQSTVERGATFLIFANRLSDVSAVQMDLYSWIPFMPSLDPTYDKIVHLNRFNEHPDWDWRFLAPIVTREGLALPVLLKMRPPESQKHPRDVFWLFSNENEECLGVLIRRGRGGVIVLPTFESNDAVVETFLHRVAPNMYDAPGPTGLTEMFTSPAESARREELSQLESRRNEIEKCIGDIRVLLGTATREKVNGISTDATAKQILVYYEQARRQPDAALFYLYKIIDSIENRFGGEAAGMTAVGAGPEWKAVKRLANESYRDARHAPKPTDVIKKWTNDEIRKCFEDTQKVVMAYFATLFRLPS